MIRIFEFDALKPEEILNRDIRAEASVEATVDAIIADVRARGDAALKDYALKFDHAQLDELRVSQAEIDEAFEAAGEDFVTTLKMAAANIRAFHEHQVHKNFVMNDTPGIVLGQKYTPIEKAGVYVPGGTAAYPSTVLMDVIPAKVAGVKEIVMTTPAGKDGKVNPVIPEVINQVAFLIIGNDMTVTMAAEGGQLELNAFEPIIFYCLFQSIGTLTYAVHTFVDNCITGITANEERCRELVESSVGVITALTPHIGYQHAADIAKRAIVTGQSVRKLILQEKLLTEEEIDTILDPMNLTKPGIPGKELLAHK